MNSPEWQLGIAAAIVVLGLLVVRGFKAWFARPVPPDPWGAEISEAIEQPEARPVCSHCQCPHEPTRWFCPECGRTVGQFTSIMPPVCYLELGDSFREGSYGRFQVSVLTVAGFLIFGLAAFVLVTPLFFLYPIYLWLIFRNIGHQQNIIEDVPPVITHG